MSVLFTIMFREYTPFASPATNAMGVAAHWQISFTFLMNVVIASGRFEVQRSSRPVHIGRFACQCYSGAEHVCMF